MANSKVVIDGRDITSDVANLDEFELYVRLNEESRVVGEELSDNLTVIGESAKWLQSLFFEDCDNYDKIIPATFTTEICGGIELNLYLTGENLINDPCSCKMRVPFKSFTAEQCCAQELDAVEWYENDFIKNYEFPMVWYANQPSFLQYILIRIRQFVIALGTLIAGALVAGFITAGAGLAVGAGLAILIRFFFLDDIDTWLTGTGRVLPAPLLRDIFEYQTAQCGLGFSSSIWQDPNSPYHNEAIIYAEAGEYLRPNELEDPKLVEATVRANSANISTLELLGMYAEKFNARYEIINGVLYFEHESWFENRDQEISVNLVEFCERGLYDDEDGVEPPKYEYNDAELWAGLKLYYTRDNYDMEGNKAQRIGIYKNNYGFTVNQDSDLCKYNPNQFDVKEVNLQFGPIRGMFDVDIKPSTIDLSVDDFRNGGNGGVSGFILGLLGVNNTSEFNDRECDLVMTSDFLFYPKTVILSDNFDRLDAGIKKRLATEEEYNAHVDKNPSALRRTDYAYKYNEHNQVPELFNRFHYTTDPNKRSDKLIIRNIDVPCDCDLIKTILAKKTQTAILTHYGIGQAKEFTISFNRTDPRITLNEVVVYCGSD